MINSQLKELVRCTITPDKVAVVQIYRPEKLNALNQQVWVQLNRILRDLEKDSRVHVVILKGIESAFAAGADITEFQNLKAFQVIQKNPLETWFEVLPKMKKVLIAAVEGIALGGGCEVALMCDIVLADSKAKFSLPEIKLGMIPGGGGTQRLTKAVGKYRAMDIILTGKTLSAQEAAEIGMVSEVTQNWDQVYQVAKTIASYSLPALILAKKAVNTSQETPLSQGLAHELTLFNQVFSLSDKEEGIQALLNKRKPNFQNN